MGLIDLGPGPGYRTAEVVAALSHALDITEGQPMGHAQRSCLIAMRLAERLDLPPDDRTALYYAVLLKDSGCSSNAARMFALFGTDDLHLKRELKTIDWARKGPLLGYVARNVERESPGVVRAGRLLGLLRRLGSEASGLIQTRCERGARIVRLLDFPPAAAAAVAALDEKWDGSGQPDGRAGRDIPTLARIASVAQTAEVFLASFGRDEARDMVRTRRGTWFDPEVADAYLGLGPEDPLWDRLGDDQMLSAVASAEPAERPGVAGEEWLDRVAEAFAGVIDAKSPYTARHSEGVARYAVAAGERLDMAPGDLRDLRRAGLLHDIGKLGVSNAILDKPDRLTAAEITAVREHPRHTWEILSRVRAFAPIVETAASHHEKLDGSGYHRGLTGEALSRPARILAVADIYEALTADRPYRAALTPDTAVALLRREAGTELCPEAVDALADAVEASAPAPAEDVALRSGR